MSDRRETAVRLAALAAALVGLLALVALAARAGVPWSGTSSRSEGQSLALVGRLVLDAVLVAFAALLLGVFVVRMRRPQLGLARGPDDEEDEDDGAADSRVRKLVVRIAPYILLAMILLLTLLFAREVDQRFPRLEPPARGTAEESPSDNPSIAPPADAATWVLAVAGGLVIFALVAASAVPAARRRLALRSADDEPEAEAVARILDESIDDLRAEPDPRRAVIAAYARMERGLAARGYARRPSEAPLEYLGRLLRELGADRDPARRLTSLFERAKFSSRAVEADAKAEAIACLVSIRARLR